MTDLTIPGSPESWMRHQQLAFAWASQHCRAGMATLFLFDGLMGHLALNAAEPMLAQIKLAWWRGEGLSSEALRHHFPQEVKGRLAPLGELRPWLEDILDSWEILVANWPPQRRDLLVYSQARGSALAGAITALEDTPCNDRIRNALSDWTLAHLAAHTNTRAVSAQALECVITRDGVQNSKLFASPSCRVLAYLGKADRKSTLLRDWLCAARAALFCRVL